MALGYANMHATFGRLFGVSNRLSNGPFVAISNKLSNNSCYAVCDFRKLPLLQYKILATVVLLVQQKEASCSIKKKKNRRICTFK